MQGAEPKSPLLSPKRKVDKDGNFSIPKDVNIHKIVEKAKEKRAEIPVWERLYQRQVRRARTMVGDFLESFNFSNIEIFYEILMG